MLVNTLMIAGAISLTTGFVTLAYGACVAAKKRPQVLDELEDAYEVVSLHASSSPLPSSTPAPAPQPLYFGGFTLPIETHGLLYF
jgi:hypothetical protein